jgi:hypothetical protein
MEVMAQINFSREGYDGTIFRDFYVRRDSAGPGWFIFGRDTKKYGVHTSGPDKGKGCYVSLCGYRIRKGHRSYNGAVRHGWRTKGEAQAALDAYLADHPQIDR